MQVTCALCGAEKLDKNMFAVHNGGKKTYECADEKKCKVDRIEYNEKQRQSKIKAFTDSHEINLDDLEELPRYRDGSIHFYDRKNDRFFIKSLHDGPTVMPRLDPDNDAEKRRRFL
jgi:hypothetical protein